MDIIRHFEVRSNPTTSCKQQKYRLNLGLWHTEQTEDCYAEG